MGWAYGRNSDGREVGYSVRARCDFPRCKAWIDRGLGYACGGRHQDMDPYFYGGCAYYFCGRHDYAGLPVLREGHTSMRQHSLKWHFRQVRHERAQRLIEATSFRRGIAISQLTHWWPLWRFANKEPQFGVTDFDHSTVFYRRRCAAP